MIGGPVKVGDALTWTLATPSVVPDQQPLPRLGSLGMLGISDADSAGQRKGLRYIVANPALEHVISPLYLSFPV